MEALKLTREDLYERVWAEPMSKLAQHYGLSDVGLAKTCKRLRVPVPGRGYWAKKAAGHKVKQIPLPDLPPNIRQSQREVTLADRPIPREPATLPRILSIQAAFETAPANRITVSDTLRGAHPLVRKTSQALRGTAKSPTAFVSNWQEPHLDVQVSRDLLSRALLVMDALVKAFDKRGWKVSLWSKESDRENDRKSYVKVLGKQVPFGIRERIKKVENPPAKPVKLLSGGMFTPSQSKYRDEPSGRLSLVLRGKWGGNGVETSLDDTPKQRVEDRLNEFMVVVAMRAYEDLEWDAGREDNERNWRTQELLREERARKEREELARIQALEQQVEDWDRSQKLTSYIAAVRAAAQEGRVVDDALETWLSWAEASAAALNPLSARLGGLPLVPHRTDR